jgi:hypothetical protein
MRCCGKLTEAQRIEAWTYVILRLLGQRQPQNGLQNVTFDPLEALIDQLWRALPE